jgi:hypothetical protein
MGDPILYIDIDNVVMDFQGGIKQLSEEQRQDFEGRFDEIPDIYTLMGPIPGAIEAINNLLEHYDVFFLSRIPLNDSSAWIDKLEYALCKLTN